MSKHTPFAVRVAEAKALERKRLQDAAPELLEALETCMGWLLDKCNCIEECGCVPEKAHAAVRKAKGEA